MSGNTRSATKQSASSGTRTAAHIPIASKEEAYQALKSCKIVSKQTDIATVSNLSAALLRHADRLKSAGQQQLQSSATDVRIYEAIAFLMVHLSDPGAEAVKVMVMDVVEEATKTMGRQIGDELSKMKGEVTETNKAVEAIAREVHARVTKIPIPSTMTYSAAVTNGSQGRPVDPTAQARTAIRYRQVRLKADATNANLGRDKDNRQLKEIIQKALDDIGAPADVKIDSAKRFPDTEEVLVEMDSEEAVDWLRTSDRLGLLATKLGTTSVARRYKTIGKFFPTTFDPKAHLDEFLEVNNIEKKHIETIDWFKPPARRSRGQLKAHVLIVFNDPKAANRAIARDVDVGHLHCKVAKVKSEPMLCRKCQRFNHLARDCNAENDTCGTCASDRHSTRDCDRRNKPRCVSCDEDGHPSYSRDCPVFTRRCEDHDRRNPENDLPFFPTDEPWTRIPSIEKGSRHTEWGSGSNSIPIHTRPTSQNERKKTGSKKATVRFSDQDEFEPTPPHMRGDVDDEEEQGLSEYDQVCERERQQELEREAEVLERQQREAQEEMERLLASAKAMEERRRELEREREGSRSRSPSPSAEDSTQERRRSPATPNQGRSPMVPGQWDQNARRDDYDPAQPGGSQRAPAKSYWDGEKSYSAKKGGLFWTLSQ